MANRKAAPARGKGKSAPKAPSVQQFQSLERRHGELIALQRETLQQFARALERIGELEKQLEELDWPPGLTAKDLFERRTSAATPDERLRFVARTFRLDFQKPKPEDTERLRTAVFGEAGMRWLRHLRLIPKGD